MSLCVRLEFGLLDLLQLGGLGGLLLLLAVFGPRFLLENRPQLAARSPA